MTTPDARLVWRELSASVQVGIDDGRVAAALYAADAGPALEFWCLLTEAPEEPEVLFGVAEGTGYAWDSRWESRPQRL